VESVVGEAHDQTFSVSCSIESLKLTTQAGGTNRRVAEQKAAQKALNKIGVK